MRDVERLRERREFSLDDRQVWAIGGTALVLLGGVFAIGVMVGRRTTPPPPPAVEVASAATAPKAPPMVPPPAAVAEEKPAPAEKPAPVEKPAQGRAPTVVQPARPATVVPPPPPPVQVASVAPVALTPPPKDLGAFTVQIGASQDRSDALRLENRARGAGLKPYVMEADLGAKGTWYRVRVGAFKDKQSAADFRKDVERELRGTAVVMPSK
jgi:DedD protein